MAENDTKPYGQICFIEVPVTSVSRASAFYSSVLGWICDDLDGKPVPSGLANHAKSIHMFNKGALHGGFLLQTHENGVAKITELGPPEQDVPVMTFLVESIDETLKKVESAGGKMYIPKTEIGGGMGFFARFIDTEGNVQGIWSKE
ncbi:uncharacterized protein Z519_03411 [Cladophialophora bantiana CBS 173.52]|uniref:VOC domain-containing protein n=1 Tax=Cladophialophora bantiana (strain ATCC 10958 / CBS 173.52 / CDC B-1940 / NIH 8579) TaxID=1442370 RepID=A0A0D2GD45_CLAB1|nr:uncharacterized protein Z519_03411 [Cladophialophora bantiana CBS 173.52]KIW96342.1 hypothetical protein Z519_03411 [Cladophialophora bantiana CBS 173.52]